jgi:hypothetical protein
VFRFTLRELLFLTLAVALGSAWWTESYRTRQWRQRAEIAADQLAVENLGKLAFTKSGVLFQSPDSQAPFDKIFTPTDRGP